MFYLRLSTRLLSASLLFLALLSGCATTPQLPLAEQDRLWQQHRLSLAQETNWALSARISGNSEDDGWSGKLTWQQTGENYRIHFQAPFGQGAAQLLGEPGYVEMRAADGQVFAAADAESLLYQQLGWRLPLAGLRYWVLGLPMPESEPVPESVLAFDGVGRLARITQAQWQIRYSGYRQVGGLALPKKMYLENASLNVRLVIDRWQFGKF